MNREQVAGIGKQFSGKLKEHWGTLMRDQALTDAGRREQMTGSLQERNGNSRQRDERQLRDFRKCHRDWNL